MSHHTSSSMFLDPAIRDWVLFPIMIVMVLVGLLRHFAMQLLNSVPKTQVKKLRETSALLRAATLRSPIASALPPSGFASRKKYLVNAFENKAYLRDPNVDENAAPDVLTDPNAMEPMMDMMKKNMAMIIPQTVIMSWISFFFSGFILIQLPFPLTVRFKSMLQSGIMTPDMDVTWVSSISWYFLNLFGLRSVFTLILGDASSADGVKDMQQMQMGQPQPMQQPSEVIKMFKNEKEYLELSVHKWAFEDVEVRLLKKYGKVVDEDPAGFAKKTK